jgi:hypothetical protein
MRFRLLLFLFSIMTIASGHAQISLQEPISARQIKNVVLISFWTMPEFTSIMGQYERIIIHHSTSFLNSAGIRLGIGSIWEWGDGSGINCSTNIFTFFGKKSHHLEIGAGAIYTFPKSFEESELGLQPLLPSFTLSYRYQKPISKIFPIGSLYWEPNYAFVFRAGIGFPEVIHLSLGYCF